MPGKPKGIHRITTAKKPSLEEKAEAAQFGKVVDYEEYEFIRSIEALESMRKRLKFRSLSAYHIFEIPILLRLRRAVSDRDSRFFDRCGEVMERLRVKPTAPTDPIGRKFLGILQSVVNSKGNSKITSTRITNLLNERHPKKDGGVYVEKDVRAIAKGLGLKFPILVGELNAATEKRRSQFAEAYIASF